MLVTGNTMYTMGTVPILMDYSLMGLSYSNFNSSHTSLNDY